MYISPSSMVRWTTEVAFEWSSGEGVVSACAPIEMQVTREVEFDFKIFSTKDSCSNFQQLYTLKNKVKGKNQQLVRIECESSILNLSVLNAHVGKRKFSHPGMYHFLVMQ